MKRHFVAVDIGGTKIAVLVREAATDSEVHAEKLPTPARGGVGAMLRVLDEQMEKLPGGRASVVSLGVAVPGCVAPDGRVVCAGNLEGWVDVPLRAQLEERYRIPVFVEGDANCGALGEKWFGAARDLNDFVFIALGTGIGAGVFLNGAIHRGAHFAAGEVGEMTFPCDERGKRATRVSDVVAKQVIKKMVRRATGEKLSAAEALARAATKRRFARATRPVVAYLSACVGAISSLLDPEAIVFGGGTSEAGEALLQRIREAIPPHLVVRSRLMLAGLGWKAQVYGALWGAQEAASASSRHPGSFQPVRAAP